MPECTCCLQAPLYMSNWAVIDVVQRTLLIEQRSNAAYQV